MNKLPILSTIIIILIFSYSGDARANSTNVSPLYVEKPTLTITDLPDETNNQLPKKENCPSQFQRYQNHEEPPPLLWPGFCQGYSLATDFNGVAGLPPDRPQFPIIICQDPLNPEKFEDKTGIFLLYQIDNSLPLMVTEYWINLIIPIRLKTEEDRHIWLTIIMILEMYRLGGNPQKPDWWGCLRADDQAWLLGARSAIQIRFKNRIRNLDREIHLLFD